MLLRNTINIEYIVSNDFSSSFLMSHYNDIKMYAHLCTFVSTFNIFTLKNILTWYLETIGVKADSELRSVDKFWFVWVSWVFYWSILVLNGVVFVWYFGSGVSSNWVSIDNTVQYKNAPVENPTNPDEPELVHTSQLGICLNAYGFQVPVKKLFNFKALNVYTKVH